MPVQLVHDNISRDTKEAAAVIFELANSGQCVGMIFGLQFPGGRYVVNVAGTCARNPTFARGMCGAIEDEIRDIIQGKATSNTTI